MRIPNKFVCTVILVILGFTLQPAFGQAVGDEQRAALAQLGIYPYPSEDEVQDSAFSSEGFVVEPLSADDINEDFSNIEDLDWLAPIAKEHQVVLVGENHYYQYTQHLRNRILFALNTVDTYPYLILEREYSMTPFANYYLSLEDEEDAKAFKGELEAFLMDESDIQLFHHLRRWNRTHPDKPIQVGCSDIEHDYSLAFQQVLFPYFMELKQSLNANGEEFQENITVALHTLERIFTIKNIDSLEELNQTFRPLDAFLTVAKEQQFVGKYPFFTPGYIETVIENLKSYYAAKTQDFDRYRQQAIIRNLTDDRFLGNYFKTGKVMIHAGAHHTPTHSPSPTGENFLREGSYLTYEFDLTKGRTYSLSIMGLAFSSVRMIQNLDKHAVEGLGKGYRRIVTQIHKAAEHNLLSSERAYAVKGSPQAPDSEAMEEFDKLFLNLCHQYQNQPLLFQQIPWDSLFNQAKQRLNEPYQDLEMLQEQFQSHDLNIIVPLSPLVRPQKKEDND